MQGTTLLFSPPEAPAGSLGTVFLRDLGCPYKETKLTCVGDSKLRLIL